MKKMIALVLSMCLMTGAFIGCGSISTSTDTQANSDEAEAVNEELPVINFYHHFYQEDAVDAKAMRAIYDEFAELHKNEFIFNPIPVEGDPQAVYDMCIQEIASGSFPDIVETGGWNVVPAASASGLILDLKPYLDEDAEFKEGVGVNYEQNMIDGKIYTVREQLETLSLIHI